MATYDRWAHGANGGDSTTGDQVSDLINQILHSAIGAHSTMGGGGSEALRPLIAGISTALPMGYGSTRDSGFSGLGDAAPAETNALSGYSVWPAVSMPSFAAQSNGDGLSLPLRGVAGMLIGLLGRLQGNSPGQVAETSFAQPLEFPAARNSSQALGPFRGASYELDYRYDGQPRRVLNSEPSERRLEIHIQALDARSILDRKEELAEAVRQAMSSAGAGQEALLGY